MSAMRIAPERLLNDQGQTRKPFRISVWPVTSQTRAPLAIGIIAATAP
jgi:hypothetical protein